MSATFWNIRRRKAAALRAEAEKAAEKPVETKPDEVKQTKKPAKKTGDKK